MLAEINKALEPILRERDIDFVVDLGKVLTSAEAFRSNHIIPDRKDNGAVGETIGVECLIGNDLLKENWVSPLVDWIVTGLIRKQRFINHVSIYPGDVGVKRSEVSIESLL